jgi:hypothetical protein
LHANARVPLRLRANPTNRLTCGADGCTSSIYIGDEYNYVYKLLLGVAGAAAAVAVEWDVRSIVGSVPDDKGIEALACAAA